MLSLSQFNPDMLQIAFQHGQLCCGPAGFCFSSGGSARPVRSLAVKRQHPLAVNKLLVPRVLKQTLFDTQTVSNLFGIVEHNPGLATTAHPAVLPKQSKHNAKHVVLGAAPCLNPTNRWHCRFASKNTGLPKSAPNLVQGARPCFHLQNSLTLRIGQGKLCHQKQERFRSSNDLLCLVDA